LLAVLAVPVPRLCSHRSHPEQIAAMVYVDTGPAKGALDPASTL
jgi:hypothetical protein